MTRTQLKLNFIDGLKAQYGEREAGNIFYRVVDHLFDKNRIEWDMDVNEDDEIDLENFMHVHYKDLQQGKPVQQVLGYEWFYDMKLQVNEHVLIPRPETEELVHWIVQREDGSSPMNVLDIGTGSGCIVLALAKHWSSSNCEGWDYSNEALITADTNASILELDNVNWNRQNALSPPEEDRSIWDIIVSNPPYILKEESEHLDKNVKEFEPSMALFVQNEDPLQFYVAIADYALKALKPGKPLYFECHESHAKEVLQMLENKGFNDVELKNDLQGKPRMVRCIRKSD